MGRKNVFANQVKVGKGICLALFCLFTSLPFYAHDWENNHVLQINREPARAYFMPYGERKGDRQLSLDGIWKFRWTKTPDERIKDFYQTDFDDSRWKTLPVPANWEVNGYGTPIYVSAGYPFKINPPSVTDEPKKDWTTYEERNPTGQYRRTFEIPETWIGGRASFQTFLRFEGVMSAFYVWVNGERVGYSQGSMEPSEFNVTRYLRRGTNQIAIEVYKYSDASYLEDQDFWRFGGIHRSITLYQTPAIRLRDYVVRTVRTIAEDRTSYVESQGKQPQTSNLQPSTSSYLLQIDPKLEVYGDQNGNGFQVVATLKDADGKVIGTTQTDAETILDLRHKAANMNKWFPQRGRRKFNRMEMTVEHPYEWTAETPYLYTLHIALQDSLGTVVEQTEQKVGFRWLDIRDGQFFVNGKPVRFRGVNRQEHDPRRARVMTEEVMLQDLRLMKAANINAIRLSHYPNVPRWYELCDSLGFYVMDEANCETHGLRGTLTSTPDWQDAFMDRVVRMAERDKNHPCIVFWSLGNESGFGANHAAMAGWLHEFDPTRFVHYEGAQGENGEPDPQSVDVISRFYPRVMQEYLNPGIPEGSDQERAENARWEKLLEIAERPDLHLFPTVNSQLSTVNSQHSPRPVLTSEYAHCMGNALGNFKEYWDEIYANKRMLGGFIWDWVDQGLYPVVSSMEEKMPPITLNSQLSTVNSQQSTLYGGDFGDKPNLKAFCMNGIVFSDRTTSAKYEEVKYVYSPVQFTRHGDDVYVINRNHHITLDTYRCEYELMENGKLRKHGTLTFPTVHPGDSAVMITLRVTDRQVQMRTWDGKSVNFHPSTSHFQPNTSVFLNLKNLSPDLQTVVTQQINVKGSVMDYLSSVESKGLSGKRGELRNKDKEIQLSTANCQLSAQFFRAPTDNDKSFGNWLAKDWKSHRLDSAEVVTLSDKTQEYRFARGSILVTTEQTLNSDGSIDLTQTYECKGDLPELPRMGLRLELPKEYEQLEWYGRGPWENYPDRKESALIGLWRSTVTDQWTHYPRPQDMGNHEDCVSVTLRTKRGKAFRVEAIDAPFSFSALHFTAQDLASVSHDFELRERDATVLSIDCAVLGLGNSSCGPGVLKKYAIDKSRPHVLRIRVYPPR